MNAARRAQRVEMVQLTGTGALIVIWAYFATMAGLAIWTINGVQTPWPTLGAVAILAAVGLAVSFDTGDRLSLPVTIFAIIAGPAMALLVSWNLLYGGYTQWYFGASTVALFYVGIRGRVLLSWVGYALLSATILAWGATSEIGLATAVVLVARQLPIMIIGTLFATGLRRTGDDIERVTAAASAGAIAEAGAAAALRERDQRLDDLGGFATSLLEKLASGAPLEPGDRIEFAVAEAEVRDSVRARSLRLPAVIVAAREARRRGVEVVLLDDSDPESNSPAELERVGATLAEALDRAVDGRVTARLLPPGRDTLATVVADGSRYERLEISR